MKDCPNCGHENRDGNRFCVRCRYFFVEPASPEALYRPRFADLRQRYLALVIDDFVAILLALPLTLLVLAETANIHHWRLWEFEKFYQQMLEEIIALGLVNFLVGATYMSLMTGRYGATLGKMLLGLRVTGENLEPVGYATAFLREFLFRFISGITMVGPFLAVKDERKQTLHDRLARTIVVKDNSRLGRYRAPEVFN